VAFLEREGIRVIRTPPRAPSCTAYAERFVHAYAGALLRDRIIGALELCCRRGEMLLIQNKRVSWETCQIGIPGATAKNKENRRIPFNPEGRLAAILERRAKLGPQAYVLAQQPASTSPNFKRLGRPFGCWRTASSRDLRGLVRPGTVSSSSGLISAGTI
jgi:hypothetical protein